MKTNPFLLKHCVWKSRKKSHFFRIQYKIYIFNAPLLITANWDFWRKNSNEPIFLIIFKHCAKKPQKECFLSQQKSNLILGFRPKKYGFTWIMVSGLNGLVGLRNPSSSSLARATSANKRGLGENLLNAIQFFSRISPYIHLSLVS